ASQGGGYFQHVVGTACVAAGVGCDFFQDIAGCLQLHRAQPAFFVAQGTLQQFDNLVFGERLEHVHPAAGEQRGDDFEGGILRGGADQPDVALLHVGQESILLGLVKAMDLVYEDDRARAVLPGALGVGHDLLDFLDAGEHGGEFDKLSLGKARDDLRQRGFAGAGRPPEDEGANIVALNLRAQRLAGADKMLLPDEFIERARTHAVSQRAGAIAGVLAARDGWEQTHTKSLNHNSGVHSVFDFSVSLCLGGDKPHCFCLITSYNTILAATPTLSDSTSGTCGMATTSFISLMRSRGNPEPSLPTKIASGPAILA